jgi:hypothetical protein
MAGSPLKRQRKAAVRAEDSSVIAFPRLHQPTRGLSHAEWRALGPGEKLERLFGMSLDDLYEIMSWPIGELDPFRLSVRVQVTRVVFTTCMKAYLNGSLGHEAARERDRERALGELLRGFEEGAKSARRIALYGENRGPRRGSRKKLRTPSKTGRDFSETLGSVMGNDGLWQRGDILIGRLPSTRRGGRKERREAPARTRRRSSGGCAAWSLETGDHGSKLLLYVEPRREIAEQVSWRGVAAGFASSVSRPEAPRTRYRSGVQAPAKSPSWRVGWPTGLLTFRLKDLLAFVANAGEDEFARSRDRLIASCKILEP